jgi:hypothetical protein
MEGIAKLVKDLKVIVERLEMKIEPKEEEKDEIKEILDEIIVANMDPLKMIDNEIEERAKRRSVSNNSEETVIKGTGHELKKQERK